MPALTLPIEKLVRLIGMPKDLVRVVVPTDHGIAAGPKSIPGAVDLQVGDMGATDTGRTPCGS